jgi:Ca2+-binding EF-hand superfamily protein
MPKNTKSGFGAGHSMTLCKAAANARLQNVHTRRMKSVRPSIDMNVPKSLLRKFDNSKGKLIKKIERKYQMREDKVTSERIKKLNSRCPIKGETIHDKIQGGSMHSPPKRAFQILMRNNADRERRYRAITNKLEAKNQLIVERLRKIPASEISKRSGSNGWNKHWKKHEHWQNTNIKRRELMQKMVNKKLSGNNDNIQSPRPPPPLSETFLPMPPPPSSRTSLSYELNLHYEKMSRTLNMSPVLIRKNGMNPINIGNGGTTLQKIVNPTKMSQPVYQEYINRMGVAEQTVFSPQAPPRKILMPISDLGSTVDGGGGNKVGNPGNEGENPTKMKRKGFKHKGRKTRIKGKRKKMPPRTMTLSEERIAMLDREWDTKTKYNDRPFSLPTHDNVMKEISELDCVRVNRWHNGLLKATLDPYMSTDGPGWMCDVCSTPGYGLVYHDRLNDTDICVKCINMARRLNWVDINSPEEDELKQMLLIQQKKKLSDKLNYKRILNNPLLDINKINENANNNDDDDDNDDGTTWTTYKPNQPNSPIQIASPKGINNDDIRDSIIYKCGVQRNKNFLLISILKSKDALLLSDDTNGSIIIDVVNQSNSNIKKRSIVTFTNIINHNIVNMKNLVEITNDDGDLSNSLKINKISRRIIDHLIIDIMTLNVTLKKSSDDLVMDNNNINDDEEEKAATRLQAQIRGANARKKGIQKNNLIVNITTNTTTETTTTNEKEQETAATRLQAQIRGRKTRRDSIAKQTAATKLQAQFRGFSSNKKGKKTNENTHPNQTLFPGEIGKVFCQKGIYFENVRMFGLVKVEIIDDRGIASKAIEKREELITKRRKEEEELKHHHHHHHHHDKDNKDDDNDKDATSTTSPSGIKTAKFKKKRTFTHHDNKKTKIKSKNRRNNRIRINSTDAGIRQLLFTIYDPTTTHSNYIKVKKEDLEQLFLSTTTTTNDGDDDDDITISNNEKINKYTFVESIINNPTTNQKYIYTLINMIRLEYHILGFGKTKMKAYMSKIKPPVTAMEEEVAATKLQSRWRCGIAKRKVKERKMLVREVHDLLDTMHERGELATDGLIMDMKHTRVELLRRILFQEEWRDAFEIASSVNKHVKSHVTFLNTNNKKLLVPKVAIKMFDLLMKHDEEIRNDLATTTNHSSNTGNHSIFVASDAEKRAACRAIFHRVDTDMSGYIDSEEFVNLLTNLMNELNLESTKHQITIDEAEYFIDSMDADGNSLIDCDEFVDFMVKGMSATDDQKILFRDRSSLHEKLSILINGLSDVTERRSHTLQLMYEKYEDKDAGGLTPDTLFQLFSEAKTDGVHRYDDVQSFFQVMDEDKNGAISRDEWCSYLLYGMSMTNEWREHFSKKSRMHNKISSIVQLCLEKTEELAMTKNEKMMLKGVTNEQKDSILKAVML